METRGLQQQPGQPQEQLSACSAAPPVAASLLHGDQAWEERDSSPERSSHSAVLQVLTKTAPRMPAASFEQCVQCEAQSAMQLRASPAIQYA